jgi:hypothetical protein
MADRDRSAIGGLNKSMDNAVREIEDVLDKYDWSGMTSDQHTEFTSKLYSIVQQKTDPKLQKNTSRERERT